MKFEICMKIECKNCKRINKCFKEQNVNSKVNAKNRNLKKKVEGCQN